MNERTDEWRAWLDRARNQSGLGTCCAEAQADGVPCFILGCDCEICARALAYAGMRNVAMLPNPAASSPDILVASQG